MIMLSAAAEVLPGPGVMRWTTPAGRSYTTRPTVYEQ